MGSGDLKPCPLCGHTGAESGSGKWRDILDMFIVPWLIAIWLWMPLLLTLWMQGPTGQGW